MDPITRAGAASDEFAADAPGGVKYPWNKIALGNDGVDDGTVSDTNPLPIKVDALPLPAGAATQASLAALIALFNTSTSVLPANSPGLAVRPIGQETWNCSFADVGAGLLTPDLTLIKAGAGVTISQSGGNLLVAAGTTAKSEFLARSNKAWTSPLAMRHSAVLSSRIVNNEFMVILADLIGEGLAYTINSATSISVTKPDHGFTAANVGQFNAARCRSDVYRHFTRHRRHCFCDGVDWCNSRHAGICHVCRKRSGWDVVDRSLARQHQLAARQIRCNGSGDRWRPIC